MAGMEPHNDTISPEWLELILESAYEGIIFIDEKGLIRYYNAAMEQLSGLKREDLIGKPVTAYADVTRLPFVLKTGKPEMGIKCKVWDNVILNRIPVYRNGKLAGAVGLFLFKQKELSLLAERLHALESKIDNYRQKIGTMLSADYSFDDIIGESDSLRRTKDLAKRTAGKETTVLLLGESGTGKEMFAHAIHNHSSRRNGPFVKVNCASIPLELIEAELFGYEPGAFTGARNRTKLGKFQLADGGTLFLDEIGDMHPAVQAKVLRVIQEKEIERLGGTQLYKVNVRLIAATNKDLEQAITDGKFRSDLYYRLSVIPIRIPSLRERIEDVDGLVDYFSRLHAEKSQQQPLRFSSEALSCMRHYDWPGNVRELLNVVIYAHNNADGDQIHREDLPPSLLRGSRMEREDDMPPAALRRTVNESSRKAILSALAKSGGNKTKAARILGFHRSTLYKMMQRLNIEE